MIPKKAIKKVKNEVHLDIAAGSLIAYGVFPQTNEGIQKAKETAASKDTWLAPSDLPEYYDGIDSDLITGKENDAIRAIRRQLKEFYGISSAGTEGYIDTRSSRPATPAGIEIQWYLINQVGPTTWKRLKAQLTGNGYFSEVNLSEKDADELIANIKKSGEFPSLKDQSGIHNEVYQNWLVDTYLPNYGKTQVYNPGDKFVDDGKEFADKIVDDLDVALEEKSNEIEDAIDAILEADKKKYEDFKKQLNRKVNHPKLYKELQHIKPRYMWGQNGLYDLVFKSDIDRAIYFAGKLGGDKDSPIKKAVREWIFAVTGLNIYDDYEEIKDYRTRIKVFILQLIKLHPDETEVIVPPIYDGAFDEPDQEEEYEEDDEEMDDEEMDDEEEADEEEYDDLYGSSLDDLLEDVRDKKEEEDPEEVADQIEEKKQELIDAVEETPVEDDEQEDEGDIGSEDEIPDELLQDDIDPSALEEILNKRKGKTGTKERKSYYVSNTKLLQGITNSLSAVSGQLEQVNQSLLEQNQLIKTNIDLNIATLEALRAQDDIISAKFDAILNAFQQQYGATKKAQDDLENLRAEQQLEQKTVVAGSENPEDLTKGKKGKGGIGGNIAKWLAKRVGKFLFNRFWKLLPKGLRSRIRLARMAIGGLKRKLPSKIASNIAPRIAQKISGNAGLRAAKAGIVSSGGRVLSSIKGGITDIGSKALAKGKGTIKTGINTITETVKSPAAKEAVTKMLGPVNKAAINQVTEPKSGLKIALAAFNNEKIRNAISKKAGKEVLEKAMAKLGFKVAGQFTGVGTVLNIAYGIGEAITRTAMGDPKGGLLSLGGAIPFVGAGFSIVDILRDIDVAAYTKHIEPNLTTIASGDGKPVAAFFNEIAGTEMQYEKGTPEAKPGTAILHGTELLIDKNKARNNTPAPSITSPLNSVGASLVSAASKFITGLGPAGAAVAPMFKQKAAPLLETFGAPATTAQTSVGGSFPSTASLFKKAEKKKETKKGDDESFGKEFDDLLAGNSESFADKLLKIVDPDGKIQELMRKIGGGGGGGGGGGDGDSNFTPSSGDPSGLADAAESLRGMSSANAPGTGNGSNGCVWAVNQVYKKAGITPPWGSSLYVPDAEKKMVAAGYTQVGFGERKPGDVMVMYDRLSPPQAHIGVVLKNGNVLSNSSSKAKFAWEASPEEYNRYYGGSGKIYRMPSTMAKTESNKLKPVATTPTANLSSTGKKGKTSNVISNSQNTVTPTTTIAQSKPKQKPAVNTQPEVQPQTIASNDMDLQGDMDSPDGMGQSNDMIAAAYGDGFPKTPKWMKEIERQYNEVKDKPFSPGTPKPGRGMGDTWMPQASVNSADQIASLSRYEEESGGDIILINSQSSPSQKNSSTSRTQIIQMGGNDPSQALKNIILQRLA